ncbi:MAG TPA: SDR family oxidoreductase [Planctomycetota bacterium]|nr:SDR family oxidoreductase [Planctomycetota bacterium]
MGKDFFRGRRALITGGSSGIGAAIGAELVRRGAHVFLVARNADRLEQAVASLRALPQDSDRKIGHAAADIRDAEQAADALKRCEERLGPVDLLINSAGITRPGYAEELPLEAYRAQMDTNYMGTVHVVKAALPLLIPRRSGWIVNLSSAAGFKGVFGYAGYCASKFAVLGFSEALRAELVRHGIGVTVVCPPDTRTPMLEAESKIRPFETAYLAAKGKVLDVETVALAALRGVERRRFLVVPGFETKFLRFANGVAPAAIDSMFDRMVRAAQRQQNQLGR